MTGYDPFARGPFPAGVRTIEIADAARGRRFPCEIWYPATAGFAGRDIEPETCDVFTAPPRPPRRQMAVRDAAAEPGARPLVVFSHAAVFHRRSSTFLCTHLASHGYAVAAMDHSEVIAPELGRRQDETPEQKAARMDAVIAGRVPDVRLLLDRLLDGAVAELAPDPARIGIVGHSFGGWTALAAPDADPRVRAVVALAPGGSSQRKPGILPLELAFRWGRDVPALYLVAENDVALPLAGMHELYERTPATKRMAILRRADHGHFFDEVEREHEAFRGMPMPPELAAMQREMRPVAELCSGEEAHRFTRGLALCHLDAWLREDALARAFWNGDLESELAARGVEIVVAPAQGRR
jgi:dienelactone hydrolase